MSESVLIRFQEDEVIVNQGEHSPYLYKVISGNVALYFNYGKPEEYLVGILSMPRCFGEMSMLAGLPSPYTIVAINEVVLLKVTEDSFDSFIRDNHQNAVMIMKTMARNVTLANMNMTMLMDELKEISTAEVVDEEALKRLTDQYLGSENAADEFTQEKGYGENEDDRLVLPEVKKYSAPKHPEYKNYTYAKTYTCIHCGQTFEDCRIFNSKLKADRKRFKKMRYDQRQAYVDFEPYWYELVSCPHCYFTAFSVCFLEGRYTMEEKYTENLKAAAKKIHLNFNEDRDINFVFLQHYLALICVQGLYNRNAIRARLWKNLTWFYEDVEDDAMRKFAAEETAKNISIVCKNTDMKTEKGQSLALTAAFMYRMCGDVGEARNWADRVRNAGVKNVYSKLAGELIEEL